MKTTKEIMISLDAQSIENVQAIVDSGRAQSKSGAIRLALALARQALDSAAMAQAVRDALEQTVAK